MIGERGPQGLRGLPGDSTASTGLPGPQGRTYFASIEHIEERIFF